MNFSQCLFLDSRLKGGYDNGEQGQSPNFFTGSFADMTQFPLRSVLRKDCVERQRFRLQRPVTFFSYPEKPYEKRFHNGARL